MATLRVHWQVNVHDFAVGSKDFAQMARLDVLGELLDDNLGIVSN